MELMVRMVEKLFYGWLSNYGIKYKDGRAATELMVTMDG
jgi:hypothetical protein